MSYTHPLPGSASETRFSLELELDREGLDRFERMEPRMCRPPAFVHPFHEELAKAFDVHRIRWQYKPRTFAIEWDDQGNFLDSFTPAFYLSALDMYIEPRVSASEAETARAIRLLLREYPTVRILMLTSGELSELTSHTSAHETTRVFLNSAPGLLDCRLI